MRIRPTELGFKGILLLSALSVAFLAASYSNLFFLIVVFCAVLGALGLWWTVRNPRSIRVAVIEPRLAPAGAERQLGISVSNQRKGTTFDVALAMDVGKSRIEVAHLPVLRGESRLTATLPPLDRGVRTIRSMLCVSRFPFGLFQVTRRLPIEFELVTFPQPFTADGHASTVDNSVDGGGALGRGTNVAGLRPFRAGDSPTDVHWKATARRGAPVVKERERACDEAVEIVLDRRHPADDAGFETALSRATTLVLRAAENDRPVQIRSQDYAVVCSAGRSIDPVLRWLANASPLPADAPPPRRLEEAILV